MMTMALELKPGVSNVIRSLATLESMKDTYKAVICPRTKNALSARRPTNQLKDCPITWM